MNPMAIFSALGLNSIPAVGWFFSNWSPGTTLAVYWFENLATALFLGVEILVHRKVHPARGHFSYSPRKRNGQGQAKGSFLSFYLPTALIFCATHAIFLALLLLVFFPQKFGPKTGVDAETFVQAAGIILFILGIIFLLQMPRLRRLPFRHIELAGERSFGRIVLVQLVIIGGMFFVMLTDNPHWMFGIFIGLKTLTDLGGFLPQYNPTDPPKWMVRTVESVGPKDKKESFTGFWHREDKEELARQKRNEESVGRK